MDATPSQPAAALSETELAGFRRRRAVLTATMVSSWVLLGAIYAFPEWASGSEWPYRAFVGLTLVWAGGFLAFWRCPRCRVLLFGSLNPRFCARCGVRFGATPRA